MTASLIGGGADRASKLDQSEIERDRRTRKMKILQKEYSCTAVLCQDSNIGMEPAINNFA